MDSNDREEPVTRSGEGPRDDLQRAGALATPKGVERGVGLQAVLGALGLHSEPVRCGRFEILEKLGEGGMGEVYRAHDPELRRDVAIKLLREEHSLVSSTGDATGGSTQDRGARRMHAEARALARLTHPNVVAVLAFGREASRTWIAMELVVGASLARWSDAHPHGPARFDRALPILRAAAVGLAAAHDAGLVHRDFKPANVLVGDDGRVRVADFGLARHERGAQTESEQPGDVMVEAAAASRITRASVVVGTPRYMAPEQITQRDIDARCDQFAFAVTAWEILTGDPPFPGPTAVARLEQITDGLIDARSAARLPTRLRTVLRRAMAAAPSDRFASMHVFLAAWDRALARRRLGLPALAAALGVAGTLWSVRSEPCDGGGARDAFATIWDAPRKAGVAEAVRATGVPWAEAAIVGVDEALREREGAWIAAEVTACKASRRAASGDAALDRHGLCRARAVDITDAWLTRLEQATPQSAERAVAAAQSLPRPDACEPDGDVPDAEETALRRELADAVVARLAGEYIEASRVAERVAERAETGNRPRVRAEALLILVDCLVEGTGADVDALIGEAHSIAVAEDASALAFDVAMFATIWRARKGHHAEAQLWLRHAEAAAARMPAAVAREISLERARCGILEARGELTEALVHCNAALEQLDASTAPNTGMREKLRTSIAGLHSDLGHYDVALAVNSALRDDAERTLGPWHPRTGGMNLNVGSAAQALGDYTLAEESYARAAEIFRAGYGDRHRWVVSALMNLGSLRLEQGDAVGAELAAEAALEACGDRRDAATARVLHNLAETRRRQGRTDDALVLLERASLIEAEVLPADHLQTASTHHTRGNALLDLGRLDEAAVELAAARRLLERSGTADLVDIDASEDRLARQRALLPP